METGNWQKEFVVMFSELGVPETLAELLARSVVKGSAEFFSEVVDAANSVGFDLASLNSEEFPRLVQINETANWGFEGVAQALREVHKTTRELESELMRVTKSSQDAELVPALYRFLYWAVGQVAQRFERFARSATERQISAMMRVASDDRGELDEMPLSRVSFEQLIARLEYEGHSYKQEQASELLKTQVEAIKRTMTAQYRSRAWLAEKTDLARSTIDRLFRSRSTGVHVGTLVRICAELNIPLLGIRDREEAETDEYTEYKHADGDTDADGTTEVDQIPEVVDVSRAEPVEERPRIALKFPEAATSFHTNGFADPAPQETTGAENKPVLDHETVDEIFKQIVIPITEPKSTEGHNNDLLESKPRRSTRPISPLAGDFMLARWAITHFEYDKGVDLSRDKLAQLRVLRATREVRRILFDNHTATLFVPNLHGSSSLQVEVDKEFYAQITDSTSKSDVLCVRYPQPRTRAEEVEDTNTFLVVRWLCDKFGDEHIINLWVNRRSIARLVDAVHLAERELQTSHTTTIREPNLASGLKGPLGIVQVFDRDQFDSVIQKYSSPLQVPPSVVQVSSQPETVNTHTTLRLANAWSEIEKLRAEVADLSAQLGSRRIH